MTPAYTSAPGDTAAVDAAGRILANVEQVVVGKRDEIALVLAALISGGHVLLEDVPGTAKTILARAIAQSVGRNDVREDPVHARSSADRHHGALDLRSAHP